MEQVSNLLDEALENLARLDLIYCNSDASARRRIIGSMFPDFFTFENLKHRTAQVSETFRFIYLINSNLECKKKWDKR